MRICRCILVFLVWMCLGMVLPVMGHTADTDRQVLNTLLTELAQKIEKADERMVAHPKFLDELRTLVKQYRAKLRVVFFSDDFSDGDYRYNPAWVVDFNHQLETLKFHVSKDRTGDWSDCGTGKTWVAINKINGLIESNKIKSCLVICPNSVMKSWGDEIRLHSDLTFCILKGSLYDKIEMLKKNRHIFVCSFDSIAGKVTKHGSTKGQLLQILLLKKFGMIVADEVSLLGNRQTNRVRSISALCDTISNVLILSGTSVTNEPQNILTVYRGRPPRSAGRPDPLSARAPSCC